MIAAGLSPESQPNRLSYLIRICFRMSDLQGYIPMKRFASNMRLSKEHPTVAVYTQREMCNSVASRK